MQDNKKVDRKVESNDSLEIPDRGWVGVGVWGGIPTPGLKEGTFDSSELPPEGFLISASAVPNYGHNGRKLRTEILLAIWQSAHVHLQD